MIKTWLAKYPKVKVPTEKHIRAFVALTGKSYEALEAWFGEQLRSGKAITQDSGFLSDPMMDSGSSGTLGDPVTETTHRPNYMATTYPHISPQVTYTQRTSPSDVFLHDFSTFWAPDQHGAGHANSIITRPGVGHMIPGTGVDVNTINPRDIDLLAVSGVDIPEQPNIDESGHDHSIAFALQTAAMRYADRTHSSQKGCKRPDSVIPQRTDIRKWQCTQGCMATFDRKDSWKKHEENCYPQRGWVCLMEDEFMLDGTSRCSYCEETNPDLAHLKEKHQDRLKLRASNTSPFCSTTFHRNEHFFQHFKQVHKNSNIKVKEWKEKGFFEVKESKFPRQCGFCSTKFETWDERMDHIGKHYSEDDFGMSQWNPSKWDSPPKGKKTSCSDGDLHSNSNDDSDSDDDNDDYGPGHDGNPSKRPRTEQPNSSCQSGQSDYYMFGSNYVDGTHSMCLDVRPPTPIPPPITAFGGAYHASHRILNSVALLGIGAHSVVDKVQDRKTFETFARKSHKGTLSSYTALLNEVEVLKHLRHRHVVDLVAVGRTARLLDYILLLPVAKMTLEDLLESPRPSVKHQEKDMQQLGCLASALDYMHFPPSKTVENKSKYLPSWHNDLKPANILIAEDARWVISDFGISKSERTWKPKTQAIQGTKMYCAPECYPPFPENHSISFKADIWALGCIFVEALTWCSGKSGEFRRWRQEWRGDKSYRTNTALVLSWIETLGYLHARSASKKEMVAKMLAFNPLDRPTAAEVSMVFRPGQCCADFSKGFDILDPYHLPSWIPAYSRAILKQIEREYWLQTHIHPDFIGYAKGKLRHRLKSATSVKKREEKTPTAITNKAQGIFLWVEIIFQALPEGLLLFGNFPTFYWLSGHSGFLAQLITSCCSMLKLLIEATNGVFKKRNFRLRMQKLLRKSVLLAKACIVFAELPWPMKSDPMFHGVKELWGYAIDGYHTNLSIYDTVGDWYTAESMLDFEPHHADGYYFAFHLDGLGTGYRSNRTMKCKQRRLISSWDPDWKGRLYKLYGRPEQWNGNINSTRIKCRTPQSLESAKQLCQHSGYQSSLETALTPTSKLISIDRTFSVSPTLRFSKYTSFIIINSSRIMDYTASRKGLHDNVMGALPGLSNQKRKFSLKKGVVSQL